MTRAALGPQGRRQFCSAPDRHEPRLRCGYPLPCPWHTVTVVIASKPRGLQLSTTRRTVELDRIDGNGVAAVLTPHGIVQLVDPIEFAPEVRRSIALRWAVPFHDRPQDEQRPQPTPQRWRIYQKGFSE